MKISKSLLITFVVLGELLLLAGLMVCFAQWPNIFQGFYVGPGLVVFGLIMEIFSLRKLNVFAKPQVN